MRRIYDSDALHRDDEESHVPAERERGSRPQSFRSVGSAALSRWLLPGGVHRRAVSVTVSTPRTEFEVDEAVPFAVEMHNAMPFPVTIDTCSPVVWTWNVDGAEEATRVSDREPPSEPGRFQFDRGERKRFQRQWPQRFRVGGAEWEAAGPGAYTIGAGIDVEDPAGAGLYDETTVRIVEE